MMKANSKPVRRIRGDEELALLTPAEVAQLIYQLEVHQIELELQNEELREIQATLETARERYFELYDLAPVGYLTVSVDGVIVEANLAAGAQLGTPRGRLVGQRFTNFIWSEDQDIYYLLIRRLAAESKPQSCELRLLRQDGIPFWARLETSAEPEHGGNVPVYRVTISDISDRKLTELLLQETNAHLEQQVAARTAELQAMVTELQSANLGKDAFLAAVSHELRTPLAGVLSLAELLEDQVAGPINARQAAYVKGITDSSERLLLMINGILSYTYLLSGNVQLQAELCSLANLLDSCAASQQQKAAAKGQAIAVQVEPPDLAITGDATAIADVLKRLLDNAVKFTPAGGRIGLEAHLGALPNTVNLVVWDTGTGIAADQMSYILKPFTQGDSRLARSYEGIGLGLAYVDQLVRLMGGTVAVASSVGAGSRFTVTLPALLPAPS
jgi:PAS domain S-box-containing protein